MIWSGYMRLVTVRFALCLTLLLLFIMGCQKLDQFSKDLSSSNSESNQTKESSRTNLQEKGFNAQEPDNLGGQDFEIIYEMCKGMLSEYYYAKANKTNVDFSKYIFNKNLLTYSHKKTLEESHDAKINNISFGVSKAELRSDGYFYLLIVAEVLGDGDSSFSEATEFLVENQDGRLMISDWYTPKGTNSYYDDKVRNEASLRLVGGWDDDDFVSKVFSNAGIQ